VLNLNNLIYGMECKNEDDDEEDEVSGVVKMRDDEHTEECKYFFLSLLVHHVPRFIVE
jgi:hypothetical protein